jgi:hypothetical protein
MGYVHFEFMGYAELNNEEYSAIASYFDNPEKPCDYMDKLLQSNEPLSKDMRRFLADVFTKRIVTKKWGDRLLPDVIIGFIHALKN